MTGYLLRRIPTAILVLFVASVLIFAIVRLIPGGPESALAGPDATPEQLAAIRHDLGLDRGFIAQYASWIAGIFTFDLGKSYQVGGEISSLVSFGLVHTILLTVTALILAVLLALALSLSATIFDNRIVNSLALPSAVADPCVANLPLHSSISTASSSDRGCSARASEDLVVGEPHGLAVW